MKCNGSCGGTLKQISRIDIHCTHTHGHSLNSAIVISQFILNGVEVCSSKEHECRNVSIVFVRTNKKS